MKRDNKNISREDFRRYLENQMTNAERNAFERELQKKPFEAEALEGFLQIPTADLENDLNELSGKIISSKKKNNTRFWAAAATFLLLVSVGIIWFQLKDNHPIPEVTEAKTVQKVEIETQPTEPQTPAIEVPVLKEESTQSTIKSEVAEVKKITEKQAVPALVPIIKESENTQIQIPDDELHSAQLAEITLEKETLLTETKMAAAADSQIRIRGLSTLGETQNSAVPARNFAATRIENGAESAKTVSGKIISLGDSLPLQGATIVEKGTTNGTISDMEGNFTLQLTDKNENILVASFIGMEDTEFSFTSETFNVIGLEPSQLALDEVVAIGYGIRSNTNKIETIKNAQPKNGMDNFRKYVDKNAVLPEDSPEKRVVVRVALIIDEQGKIISFENTNNVESELFEKTKQILLSGPEWNPETINEIPVESEVTLRIVFRKNK
jgi:hypothetical protein